MDTITIKPAEVLVVKVTPVVSGGTVEGGGGASDIGDLTSVTITNPQNGDVLVYDGGSWVNTSGIATESYVGTQISSVQSQVANNDSEISALQSSVAANETSISSLESADTTLQGSIDAEASARATADNALQSNIDAEEVRAIAAEGVLQANIDTVSIGVTTNAADIATNATAITTEASTRAAADTALQTDVDANTAAISAEATARANADTNIQAQVTANDGDITALDSRLTTAESDIDTLEVATHVDTLNSLTGDVTLAGGVDIDLDITGDTITINSTASGGGGGGGGSDSFNTIAVSSEDNVVADSGNDTLTLVEGANINITTDATTKAIEFAVFGLTTDDVAEGSNLYYTEALVTANSSVVANTAKNSYPTADAGKLALIEDGAQVNPTALEIKTAYESNNDTNAFTDDEKTKVGNSITALSDDGSPSLGGELTAGEDINVSSGKVVRFGGSTSNFPSIGMDSALTEIDLDLGNYDFVINGDASNSNLTINGSTLDINASTTTTNAFISTGTLSTGGFTATSANITGNITVNGTVDGRDVSDDGDKLDTLEFAANVNVAAVPSGGEQGKYAIVWDQSAQEWQSKIPTLPNLNYIDNVDTSGGTIDNGALLKWDDNNNEWRPSSFDGTGVITTDISDTKQALSNIEGILKTSVSEGTKLYYEENETTKAYLNLGETDSFFGVNNTGFNVEKNSPGTVTISVDAGPSPEASFDAFVVSGTTTAGTATTTISEGNTLTFSSGVHSASITPSALTGDVDINLPSSNGTLALTSDVTLLEDETSPALGADLDAGANNISFDTGYGVNFVTDSSLSRIDFDSGSSTLRILSGNPIGGTNLSLYCGASGDVNIGPLGEQIVFSSASLNLGGKNLLFGSGANDITIQAPSLAADTTLTLPDATGTLALTSDITASGFSEVANETGTTRTLTSTDAGKYIVCTNASAITVSVNTGVFSVGDEILIEQGGAGQVTIAGTATVNTSSANTKKTAEQYAVIGLKCVATDTFTLTGERELA